MNEQMDPSTAEGAWIASNWVPVTQAMIDQFGATTLDPDPMHMDPQWAQVNSPFKGTIAYGFLTVSLLTHLFHDARKSSARTLQFDPDLVYLNYGFDRLRLVSAVPVNSRIRGHFTLINSGERTRSGHCVLRVCVRVEIEGNTTPALIAEWLTVGLTAREVAKSG
jgi:acyl dehydratase